jgi:hypothetical protein
MADAAEEEDPPGYVEAEVREFFDKFDSDGSGNVNPDEFRELCEELQPGMEDEAKEEALQELDGDGDGEISFAGASSTLVVVWQRVCDSFHCTSVMVGVSTDAQTGRSGVEFSAWWREQMRSAAQESGGNEGSGSSAEVKKLESLAEPVKEELAKRYFCFLLRGRSLRFLTLRSCSADTLRVAAALDRKQPRRVTRCSSSAPIDRTRLSPMTFCR